MVKALSKVSPPWSVTRTVTPCEVAALVVEQRAVRDRDLAGGRIDREPAAGIVGQRIAERRAGVGIDAGDRADHRAVGGVLGDRAAGQRRVGRRLVDVGDVDA